ncbi:MAG TPA: hypothetical protein DDZ80_00060 [Cyanobacteria bacterium UBA8803]|nr:hypothetical protein [Cyanobacteria bacterium UBA9273]HBL57011.1 hypothetical protein [Cyanobacteria bacterium UBA8803]
MTNPTTTGENYDRGIMPAETAARIDREKEGFKQTPVPEGSIDTTGGYTVDREGLANNFAIEPEMYVNEPGDLREKYEAEAAERAETLKEINQTDEDGKLTMEQDTRGKGPGLV